MTNTSRILAGLVAATCLGVSGNAFCAPARSLFTVQARGLRVVGEGVGGRFHNAVRPFNWSQGTSVALLIRRAEGGIIGIDRDASTITRFQDSTGTDLLKQPEKKGAAMMVSGRGGYGMMPRITKDRSAAIIKLNGPAVPAKGATAVKAQGTIVLVCANSKKHFTQPIKLKVGSKVTVGPVPLEITKVAKPRWGNAAMAVTFTATQPLDAIAGISFSSHGQKIETRDGGQSSMKAFNTIKVEKTINFAKKIDAATIGIEAWQDIKRVKVPFDLTIGVGL